MKEIKEISEAIKNNDKRAIRALGYPICWAYARAREFDLEAPNFSELYWEEATKPTVATCRRLGIKTITYSNTAPGVLDVLGRFEAEGCKVMGIKKIQLGTEPNGEPHIKTAAVIKVN